MSGQTLRTSFVNSSGVCTIWLLSSKPPCRSSRNTSSASSALSSTSKTRIRLELPSVFSAAMDIIRSCRNVGVIPDRSLIHHQPVQPHLLHRGTKLIEVDRLLQETVGTQAVTCHYVALLP